jgi:phospholipid/cholesterol/gamma-HCH transport system ATP-binding protein
MSRLSIQTPAATRSSHSTAFENREKSESSESRQPFLALRNVSKSFGSNLVLDCVSFAVMRGETLCVMGRSGVGKSVCLQILMGFLKPDSGTVIVGGEDITGYSEEQLQHMHKKVTMVFQDDALFNSLTVGENVAYALRERGELDEVQINRAVENLLDKVGISAERDRFPADLSTGMKRSVAIARALAENPEAVLYDEPTTMVDPLMAHRLGKLMARVKIELKLTSIVVTHDTHLAETLADHVLFLDHSKVLSYGTVGEMEGSSEPLVQAFLGDDQQEFHFADEKEEEKNNKREK